jgi:hypothetical protein
MASHSAELAHDAGPTALYILLSLAISIAIWASWVGTMFARLWYYKGKLQDEFHKFDIEPEYIRDRLTRQKKQHAATGNPKPVMNAHQWQANVRVMDEDELENIKDPHLRKMILEEQRIASLPAFEQDDLGDASKFPDVPPAMPATSWNERFRGKSTSTKINYRSLGLVKLGQKSWLVIDNTYAKYRKARDILLDKKHDECVQVTRDGEAACWELLEEVAEYLTTEYPRQFSLTGSEGRKKIQNHYDGSMWPVQPPFDCHPLEICARLTVEDFCVLGKSGFTGQYSL